MLLPQYQLPNYQLDHNLTYDTYIVENHYRYLDYSSAAPPPPFTPDAPFLSCFLLNILGTNYEKIRLESCPPPCSSSLPLVLLQLP